MAGKTSNPKVGILCNINGVIIVPSIVKKVANVNFQLAEDSIKGTLLVLTK